MIVDVDANNASIKRVLYGNDDSCIVSAPQTEAEYNRLVAMLDELVEEVGEDEASEWLR